MTPNWNVVTGSPSTVRFYTTYGTTTDNLSGWYPTKWFQRVGEDYREVPGPSVPSAWPLVPSIPDGYEEVPSGGANPLVYPFAPCVEPVEPKPLRRRRPGVPEDGEADTPLDQRVKHVLEDL